MGSAAGAHHHLPPPRVPERSHRRPPAFPYSTELTGLLQAIIHLERQQLSDQDEIEAIMCSDSLYAIGCTEGKLNGERNKAMYLLVRERFRKEQQRRGGRLELLHVKGHSGDIGNDHADRLAWWGKRAGPYSQLPVVDKTRSEEEENDRENERLDAKLMRQREEEAMEPGDPDYEHLAGPPQDTASSQHTDESAGGAS